MSGAANAHPSHQNNSRTAPKFVDRQVSTAGAQSDELRTIHQELDRIARALEVANNAKQSAEERKLEIDNRDAQAAMARWAEKMFYTAVVELSLTAGGIFLLWRTLNASWAAAREARRAADIAENATNKLERPHLFIESPEIEGSVANRIRLRLMLTEMPNDFMPTYDIFNYGRSPGIIVERSASVYIGEALPSVPEVNTNDVYTDVDVIPATGSRKGFGTLYHGTLDSALIEKLHFTRNGGEPPNTRCYLFVRLKYESVYGTVDEVGEIWEYLIDLGQFMRRNIPGYTYRVLGE
jgi:hypothetical protein